MGQVLEFADLVTGNIKDAELGIRLETGDGSDGIVRNIEFFELAE
jgi:hypothetical protein